MGSRNAHRRLVSAQLSDGMLSSVIIFVCFVAGIIGGFLLALMSNKSAELYTYLQQYFIAIGQNGDFFVSVWSILWDIIRWPLLIVVLSMTQVRIIAIPLAIFIRGFLLSYATTVFSCLFGRDGFWIALIVFGTVTFIVIPVLFILTSVFPVISRGNSRDILPAKDRWSSLLVCTICLAFATAIQWRVVPTLMSLMCADF